MRLLFVTGEASGDLYASRVIREILSAEPGAEVWAVGGRHCREAGARLLLDSSRWGAIGVSEALRRMPLYLRGLRRIAQFLRRSRPNLLVMVDFGAFNRRVSALAKRLGVRRLYYIPPGCWSRSEKAARRALGLAEAFVVPLPWFAEMLSEMGAKVFHVGHPLLEVVRERRGEKAPRKPPPDRDGPKVALLPGSREAELRHCLPAMVEAARLLLRRFPQARFLVSIAPNLEPQKVKEAFPPDIPTEFFVGAAGALERADVAVVVSGTATLEAALWRCPHVCIYRGSTGMSLQYRLLGRGIRFVALPNIVLEREVVPELLQADASPRRIALEVRRLLADDAAREAMLSAFEEIERLLDGPPASKAVADLALKMAGEEDLTSPTRRAYAVAKKR